MENKSDMGIFKLKGYVSIQNEWGEELDIRFMTNDEIIPPHKTHIFSKSRIWDKTEIEKFNFFSSFDSTELHLVWVPQELRLLDGTIIKRNYSY